MSEDLAGILRKIKGQRLVFVCGNFNVIHPGHLRILRFANECGDCLVVGVNSDALAEGGTVISEALRLEGVRANSFVDHAFLLECSPAEAIHALQPNVVVKGTEHEQQSNPERAAVEAYGGRLLFCSGDTVFSSFDLLERETEWTGRLNDNAGQNYCDRHGIHIADLNELIQRFEQLTVCVVGDLIVDEYVTCEPVGMSQEDPTLVVSPLIALMKDQVDALVERDVAVTLINSTLSWPEQKERLDGMRRGDYRLVYIAPERFKASSFMDALKDVSIEMVAIDEAHCLSQWGHDFRPDYMRLGKALEALGRPQCVALTATATPIVREDIRKVLQLREPFENISGFERPNLSFTVTAVEKVAQKYARLQKVLKAHKTGIVYCATRKKVDEVAETIHSWGLKCVAYHGGMSDQEREDTQNTFISKNR